MPNSALAPMPTASTLDGSELYYTVQNNNDRKVGGLQMKRTLLTANTTYYVNTTGNDVITGGTAAAPWATLQYASDFISQHVDLAGFTVTIQLAAGTGGSPKVYGGINIASCVGGGMVLVETSDGDPTHTTMSSGAAHTINATTDTETNFGFGGMMLTSTGNQLINISADITVFIGTNNCPAITLGTCGNNQFLVSVNDHGTFSDSYLNNTTINLSPQASGCQGYVYAANSAVVSLSAIDLASYVISGNPAWGLAFIYAEFNAHVAAAIQTGFNVTGASTGLKFFAQKGAVFDNTAAFSALPGSIEGYSINAIVSDATTILSYISNVKSLIGYTLDNGSVSSGTVSINVLSGQHQKVTLTGSVTLAFSSPSWPSAGIYGETNIELVNGSTGVTWPVGVKWNIGTGTWSSSFPGSVALSTGTNFIKFWSTDGGTTVYGSAI